MLLNRSITLLTCCSLVFATLGPQHTFARSERSVVALPSLTQQMEGIATISAESATAFSTVVDDHYPDSLQAACGSIQYGQTVSGFLSGEADCHTFSGQSGDLLFAQLESSATEAVQLTLSGPGVTTRTCTSSATCVIFDVTVSASGVHTLTVFGSGYYQLYLGLLDTPPMTLTYGETVTGSISAAGEQDAYHFNGKAGDHVFVYINSPIGTEFNLSMFLPDSGSYSCISYETCLIGEMTLPATGLYTLLVNSSGSYTGDYSLTLGTSDPLPISIGQSRAIALTSAEPLTYQIDVPSSADHLFITLQKNAGWYWQSTLALSRSNQVIKSVDSWEDQIIHVPAPSPGMYELTVTGTGEGTLSVLASLPDLPLGQWVTGTILRQDGLAWYQSTVPAGQEALHFYAETLGLQSYLGVYPDAIDGSPSWSSMGSPLSLAIASPGAGTYYVQLRDSAYVIGDTQARDHLIRADVAPIGAPTCTQPVVSSFTPTQGGTGLPVTVVATGLCFEQQSSVCLARQGADDVCAGTVVVDDNGRTLSAIFDLSDAAQGQWSLVVTGPSSQAATAPKSFTVNSGGEPNLWVDIAGRAQFRIGRTQTYHVRYGNSGPVDAYDVVLYVKIPAVFQVSVDLPHPQDDSVDWESIPLFLERGSEKVIPLWLFRVGADSQVGFDLSLTLPTGQVGEQATIRAELVQVDSKYAQTGNLDDVEDSPVFLALLQAMSESPGSSEGTAKHALSPALNPGSGPSSMDGLREELKAAIIASFYGLVGAVAFGSLFWLVGLSFGTGLLIGGCVGTAVGTLEAIFQPFSKLLRALKLALIDSTSPEDKFGPTGADSIGASANQIKRWIPRDRMLEYRVEFWNKEDALAATVDVIISDTLDADLDWSTFRFTEIGFLDWRVPLEPAQHFNVDVANVSIDLAPYYPGEPVVDMVVSVEGTYDSATGYITWQFHALDPTTRQPPDNPYAGFLPPITDSGWEVGWVEFSVAQKPDLASGTVIQNQAFVTFDQNPPNPAPKAGPFVNTVDGIPPTSFVQPLSGSQPCSHFVVSWVAQDDQNGSGIEIVNLYVDDLADSSPAYLWYGGVPDSQVMFRGVPGRSYGFYTRARDNVGNLEFPTDPLVLDTQTTVDAACIFLPEVRGP